MSDTTTPIVTGTDFITVPTKDIAASEAFYGGLLGLTFAKRWGKMPGAEYETGNLTLALMEPEASAASSGRAARRWRYGSTTSPRGARSSRPRA